MTSLVLALVVGAAFAAYAMWAEFRIRGLKDLFARESLAHEKWMQEAIKSGIDLHYNRELVKDILTRPVIAAITKEQLRELGQIIAANLDLPDEKPLIN